MILFQVETRNRFTSLFSSKSVAQHRGVLDASDPSSSSLGNASSELLTPRRRTSSVSGTDRQTFHKVFSAMIKSNQLHSAEKLDRQASYRREKSNNDAQVYQNDSGDLIWLELQAWFAGRTVMEQDAYITSARRSIRGVIDEILDFHFETDEEQAERLRLERERESSVMSDRSDGTVDASTSSDIYYDAYEEPSSSFKNMMVLERGISEVSNVSELDSDSSLLKMDYCFDDIRYSLDVFNEERVMVMNMALSKVANLLEKVERAEQYYASERTFKSDQNIAGNREFQARMKCLCMWYNLTDQLRCKIKVLGNVLLGLGSTRRVPWPCWLDDPTGASVLDDPLQMSKSSVASTSDVTLVPSESSRKNTPNHSRSSSLLDVDAANRLAVASMNTRVRFNVSEEDANSTNPSDSNNSTSTTDSAANSQPNSALPTAIVTETGRQISNSSCGNYFFISDGSTSSQLDMKSGASPYRKYVDKYLKTKGLRKTMYFLNRVIRGPLRRTKMALERQNHVIQSNHEQARKWSGTSGVPYHPHLEERFSSHPVPSEERRELSEFGVWNPEFMRMNLPSFRAPYLFLCRIPLDVIHECLKIRLEQKPHEPSELSIRQVRKKRRSLLLGFSETLQPKLIPIL